MKAIADGDTYLLLSGIQHMAFCERQWALIHIEQQWEENSRTVEGKHMHQRVDNPFEDEFRGDLYILRSLPLISHMLKLRGVADVVEFLFVEAEGIPLSGKPGLWVPRPVEYKRGRQKPDDRDSVQLCAQAICLEEMFGIMISDGDLFYGETRRRQFVRFDSELRQRVKFLANRMNYLFEKGVTPPANRKTNCQLCSLKNICMPKLTMKKKSVKDYIEESIREINI